jgi:dUTPase
MEILAAEDLISAVENRTLIKNGRRESCEGIKYDFTLNKMVLTADSKGPIDIDQFKEKAVIKPGEIAFVMTEEVLELDDDIYCQLSTKRKLSLDGIVALGGLIIDPNYKGKLIFGLYNLSSHDFLLRSGKKLIAGVFYRINEKSSIRPEPINDFPDELVKVWLDRKPNSINSVNAAIDNINNTIAELRNDMQAIKNQLAHDDKWKDDFQNGLTEIRLLIKEMGEKLTKEIDTRTNENRELYKEQGKLKEAVIPLSKTERIFRYLIGAITTIIIGVIVFVITKFIK